MKLFRDSNNKVKPFFNLLEGKNYQESPLDFLFLLSRYKFASKLIEYNDKVLDAGCGIGIGSIMLNKFSKSVTGIDIDDEIIKYCKCTYQNINNLNFKTFDIKNQLDDNFNVIVCLDVIEHFTKDDGNLIIKNLFNSLNKYGMLIIGTPNIESQKYASQNRKLSHIYEYNYNEFKSLLNRFNRSMIFSMTDENVNTGFSDLSWYFIGVAIK